jgi:hypothetical protein
MVPEIIQNAGQIEIMHVGMRVSRRRFPKVCVHRLYILGMTDFPFLYLFIQIEVRQQQFVFPLIERYNQSHFSGNILR